MSKYNSFKNYYNYLKITDKFEFFLYLYYLWDQKNLKKSIFNKNGNNLHEYLLKNNMLFYFPIKIKNNYKKYTVIFLKFNFNKKIYFIIDQLIFFEKNKLILENYLFNNYGFKFEFYGLIKMLLKYLKVKIYKIK